MERKGDKEREGEHRCGGHRQRAWKKGWEIEGRGIERGRGYIERKDGEEWKESGAKKGAGPCKRKVQHLTRLMHPGANTMDD